MDNKIDQDKIGTMVSIIKAEKDAKTFALIGNSLVGKAKALEIKKIEDKQIADMLKKECLLTIQNLESKRREITVPVGNFITEVNALFKATAIPLLEAQNTVKSKILTYDQEQEKIKRELEEKAMAEERERLLKLEEERLERERIEKIKREEEERKLKAEQDRLKKLEEERLAKEIESKRLNETEQRKIREEAEKQRLEKEKLEREKLEVERMKRDAEEEKKKLDEERREMELKRLAEIEKARKEAELKVKGIFKRWTWEVVKEEKIPRAFCSLDSKKINQAIKLGIRQIDGIRIFQAVSVK